MLQRNNRTIKPSALLRRAIFTSEHRYLVLKQIEPTIYTLLNSGFFVNVCFGIKNPTSAKCVRQIIIFQKYRARNCGKITAIIIDNISRMNRTILHFVAFQNQRGTNSNIIFVYRTQYRLLIISISTVNIFSEAS